MACGTWGCYYQQQETLWGQASICRRSYAMRKPPLLALCRQQAQVLNLHERCFGGIQRLVSCLDLCHHIFSPGRYRTRERNERLNKSSQIEFQLRLGTCCNTSTSWPDAPVWLVPKAMLYSSFRSSNLLCFACSARQGPAIRTKQALDRQGFLMSISISSLPR